MLVLGLIVVPLAMLAAVEGLLRTAGLGDLPPAQASKLAYQQVYPPLLEAGQRPDGSDAWITNDARIGWQALDRPKASAALRIVAVGGSATAGLGFSPNVSFPRELQRALAEALPGREVEVLNLGIVALSSSQVRWIVDDACAHFDPDIVLVYSGNNEFLEIHAQKFAASGEAQGGGVAARLADTNLFRLAGGLRQSAARGRAATVFDMAGAQARVSETEMMTTVSLSDAEHRAVVDSYEANLRAMVASAHAAGAELLLMTVASNWQWQGRHDLPADWIESLLGSPVNADTDLLSALALIEDELLQAPQSEQHTLHFKRGQLLAGLGRHDEARQALRLAMNSDPRQRRATDELAERVRAVAAETDVGLFDVIEGLAAASDHGIVGDAHFYDYVHFTPRGCATVAAGIVAALQERKAIHAAQAFDGNAWLAARIADYDALAEDPLEIGDWLGLGDVALVHDRELWKHQQHVQALDARLEQDPDDVDALVRRANAAFFMRDGFDDAVAGYERALQLQPDHEAAARNLERLTSTRRP